MRLNEAYTFPDHIVRALVAYDPLLRIRWGRQEQCVRLERKVRRGRDVDPKHCQSNVDDYEAARDGYACVYKAHPHQGHQLLAAVNAGDIRRQGGARRVAERLEAEEAAAQARARSRRVTVQDAVASDLFRHINTVRTTPEGAGWRTYRGTGRGERLD